MSPQPLPSLTRRTTIGAALAALAAPLGAAALAGCEAGDGAAGSGATPSVGGTGTLAGEGAGDLPDDPDTALVEQTRRDLDDLVLLLAAVGNRSPQTARALAPLTAAHEAHRAALPAAEGGPAMPPRVTGSPARQWALVRQEEERAVRRLGAASMAAESGTLARLLASMAAGTAAHLAALPEQVPAGAGR